MNRTSSVSTSMSMSSRVSIGKRIRRPSSFSALRRCSSARDVSFWSFVPSRVGSCCGRDTGVAPPATVRSVGVPGEFSRICSCVALSRTRWSRPAWPSSSESLLPSCMLVPLFFLLRLSAEDSGPTRCWATRRLLQHRSNWQPQAARLTRRAVAEPTAAGCLPGSGQQCWTVAESGCASVAQFRRQRRRRGYATQRPTGSRR